MRDCVRSWSSRLVAQRGLYSLGVKNFGILGDVEVQLGRLNVLVGPNGSGKTTLLKVIGFLGEAARSQLADAVAQHGGFERLSTRRRPGTRLPAIEVRVVATVTARSHEKALDEYELKFRPLGVPSSPSQSPRGRVFYGVDESFTFKRTAGRGRRITLKSGRLSVEGRKGAPTRLVTLDKEAFGLALLPQLGEAEGAAEVRRVQEFFTTFRVFDVDTVRARQPTDARVEAPLRPDASNLAAFLLYLHATHTEVFASLKRDARAMVPGLRDIKLRVLGGPAEAVAVEIVDEGLPGTTPLADASFGTVRALALLAMLHDPNPPLLTCVEEIDHGFHPHVFDRLVELLREASTRTQFLIVTHSPALVNRLRPEELIVCERDPKTGLARIPAVDPQEVAEMHEESGYGLGELWFSGTLGGVPK